MGLLSGRYSSPVDGDVSKYQQGIKPSMFKALIGRGHHEFSTKRQQDAVEFLLHLINVMEVSVELIIYAHVRKGYQLYLISYSLA